MADEPEADAEEVWLICAPVATLAYPEPGSVVTACIRCAEPVWRGPHAPPEALPVCTHCGMVAMSMEPDARFEGTTPAQRDGLRRLGWSEEEIDATRDIAEQLLRRGLL